MAGWLLPMLLSSSHPCNGVLMLSLKKSVIIFISQMMKLRHKGKQSAKCVGRIEGNNSQSQFSCLF